MKLRNSIHCALLAGFLVAVAFPEVALPIQRAEVHQDVYVLERSEAPAVDEAFSPSDGQVLHIGKDGSWTLQRGGKETKLLVSGGPSHALFLEKRGWVVGYGFPQALQRPDDVTPVALVMVLDAPGGEVLYRKEFRYVYGVGMSPDEKHLLIHASSDKSPYVLLQLDTWTEMELPFAAENNVIKGPFFSSDGSRLVQLYEDKIVQWDVAQGKSMPDMGYEAYNAAYPNEPDRMELDRTSWYGASYTWRSLLKRRAPIVLNSPVKRCRPFLKNSDPNSCWSGGAGLFWHGLARPDIHRLITSSVDLASRVVRLEWWPDDRQVTEPLFVVQIPNASGHFFNAGPVILVERQRSWDKKQGWVLDVLDAKTGGRLQVLDLGSEKRQIHDVVSVPGGLHIHFYNGPVQHWRHVDAAGSGPVLPVLGQLAADTRSRAGLEVPVPVEVLAANRNRRTWRDIARHVDLVIGVDALPCGASDEEVEVFIGENPTAVRKKRGRQVTKRFLLTSHCDANASSQAQPSSVGYRQELVIPMNMLRGLPLVANRKKQKGREMRVAVWLVGESSSPRKEPSAIRWARIETSARFNQLVSAQFSKSKRGSTR